MLRKSFTWAVLAEALCTLFVISFVDWDSESSRLNESEKQDYPAEEKGDDNRSMTIVIAMIARS